MTTKLQPGGSPISETSESSVLVSIAVPALNEELTIGDCGR